MLAAVYCQNHSRVLCRESRDSFLADGHRTSPIPEVLEEKALSEVGRRDLPMQVQHHVALGIEELTFAVRTPASFFLLAAVGDSGVISQSTQHFAGGAEIGGVDQKIQIRHL